ncbi:MAG: aldo/keto reductase [Clostridiales bacterium]|jgi:predicted oxidoreductase|nr:aldo/keto reductase [Clostridiales bacterium]
MKKIPLGESELNASQIALGCMRINRLPVNEAQALLKTALDNGIDFFDHADVYGGGASETLFAEALKLNGDARENIILQSKCGIRNIDGIPCFDFSKEHILNSVDGILKRLRTDYLDVLLLHRPDALVEPEEVGEAFDILRSNDKVRYFGVSNQSPMLIKLLQRSVKQRLIINQVQFSIAHSPMIDQQINFNNVVPAGVDYTNEILEFCRLENITIQPWSPFQYGFFEGVFVDSPKFPKLNEVLGRLATEKGVTKNAIVIAWLLRHPAKMQPIVGTTNAGRLAECCKASDVTLSRKEWYEIYTSFGRRLP